MGDFNPANYHDDFVADLVGFVAGEEWNTYTGGKKAKNLTLGLVFIEYPANIVLDFTYGLIDLRLDYDIVSEQNNGFGLGCEESLEPGAY